MTTVTNPSRLAKKTKEAEIRLSMFIVEHNIATRTVDHLVSLRMKNQMFSIMSRLTNLSSVKHFAIVLPRAVIASEYNMLIVTYVKLGEGGPYQANRSGPIVS